MGTKRGEKEEATLDITGRVKQIAGRRFTAKTPITTTVSSDLDRRRQIRPFTDTVRQSAVLPTRPLSIVDDIDDEGAP